jgi:spore coat polysaccharide biosynthesis protein SpsF (cytidylyltransferase family)
MPERAHVIGGLIPVRSGASRLPGKPLRDVAGKSALARVAARAAACRYVSRVIVATTVEPADDALAAAATALGLGVYRGPVDDVLRRLAEAAAAHGLDVVVEVDGDDLLCAPEYMDRGVELLEREGADLVHFEGLPIGATPNVLRTSALAHAVAIKDYEDTATGFFRVITESGQFKVLRPRADDPAHLHETVRMTLDYPQDLAFFSAVFAELDQMTQPSFADLIALLRRRPDLVALNQGLDAAYQAHFAAGLRR